jgi:phosphoribosyl-ATP pyrophosphohydrolase|tara:strand:+ start:1002 stop:1301 length:300 start_codon:yes stop_codon:yes gene_type:complete
MNYTELEKLVLDWADEKGILEKSNPIKQIGKTQEELTETLIALVEKDDVEIKDGIGDMLVTIIILSKLCDMTTTECLEAAYDVIKVRKGKMINGLFVKE